MQLAGATASAHRVQLGTTSLMWALGLALLVRKDGTKTKLDNLCAKVVPLVPLPTVQAAANAQFVQLGDGKTRQMELVVR